jgi:hypothetical protein
MANLSSSSPTAPYKGITNRSESVEPSAHMYRRNLESIFHCILDITLDIVTNFQDGRKVIKPTLYTGVVRVSDRVKKRSFLHDKNPQLRLRPRSEGCTKALRKLKWMFAEGYNTVSRDAALV